MDTISVFSFHGCRPSAPRSDDGWARPARCLTDDLFYGCREGHAQLNVMGLSPEAALEASVPYLASDLGPKNRRHRGSAGPIEAAGRHLRPSD